MLSMHLLWIAISLALFKCNYGQEETTANIEDMDAIFDPLYDPILIEPQQTNKCGVRNKNHSIELNQAENQAQFGELKMARFCFFLFDL